MTTYASYNPGDDSDLEGDSYTRGMKWVKPWTKYRRNDRGGYYVSRPCYKCGVYGHPCECEETGNETGGKYGRP